MIYLVVSGDIDSIRHDLQPLLPGGVDVRPLAESMVAPILAGNNAGIAAGTDKDGEDLVEIKQSTRERRRRAGKGDGHPLSPDGEASRIGAMLVEQADATDTHVVMICSWPEANAWIGHHVAGDGRLPVRDIVGIRPDTWAEIDGVVDDFVSRLLGSI